MKHLLAGHVLAPLFLALLALSPATEAQSEAGSNRACLDSNNPKECGWFWGHLDDDEEEKEEEQEKPPEVIAEPREETSEEDRDCTDPDEWEPSCGFVDPQGSFDFQAKQRDMLLNQAVMSPNNPETVERFQRYMRWAVDQAITMSRMWEWNQIQNQDLNPLVHSPVSSFGLRAASRAQDGKRNAVMEEINDQGGFLVWFTRSTCQFCHDMQPVMKQLGRRTGLTIYNAPLDNVCMSDFTETCDTTGRSVEAAGHLAIEAVPDLWLHLPQDDLWFRVSSGVEAAQRITSRIEVFFGAIQRAAEKGLNAVSDGAGPAVDFSVPDMLERSSGGLGAGIPQGVE
ncbi:conserved exported hypothetical protein [Halomonas sp. A3H3]|uniref:Conjugal transfer protein TraF n=1 Tax=Vreelandella salicampi TaxID=1449798 RepID=A0A7Z0RVU9_9GAMM|nr:MULTISPECIES: conjugal transfer protein TraF [Halomonas]MCD1651778.1 conjugal transfer protein TraF [Halomonas axialensis]MCD2088597.1 conjugal transfer protein TraF [Halomonas meridiana]NYS61987.1 conjugal transfer protein TraF [Halomonas salicampi]CDG56034.1 conserved exported hypothetical protein [Halomonas sp. A3H3]|tara:strand:+ start:21775 stop:22797 length:1023 start_codon:yes stop_codon:yes gene_type:complete